MQCELLAPHEVFIGLETNAKEHQTLYRGLFEEALDLDMIDDLRKATPNTKGVGVIFYKPLRPIFLQY